MKVRNFKIFVETEVARENKENLMFQIPQVIKVTLSS